MNRVLAVFLLVVVNVPIILNAEAQPFLTLPIPSQAVVANGWAYGIKSLGDRAGHYAIDYDVATGTSVIAAADGYAMKSYQIEDGYGYGHMVVIRHNEKNSEGEYFYTLYAHLSEVMEKIPDKSRGTIHDGTDVIASNWQLVKRGEEIGKSGISGGQTWQHLHFVPFAGEYKMRTTQKSYDPYDLYKQPADHDSSTYYPPIFYLNEANNIYNAQYSSNERTSGKNYTHSGINGLWVTDPPFPPVFVHPLGGKSSGTLRIQGLNFGENKGTVRVSYESERFNASQIEILTPTAIQWTDTEIQMELFGLSGLDWASFNTPILVELFKQSGEKISEFWYPFVDVPIGTYYALPATQLWKRSILNGTSKGGYRFLLSYQGETRAEFLKKLVEASGYNDSVVTVTPDNGTQPIACAHPDFSTCQIPPFTDVWPDHKWAYAHMIIAHNLGWFKNDDGNVKSTFKPQNVITRAEAAKWLIKAKNLSNFMSGYHLVNSFLMVPHVFSDVPFGTSAWYFDYVYIARSLGIFGGFEDGSFGPDQRLTKAQAAKVIYNFMAND
jgi:hypothetical protein